MPVSHVGLTVSHLPTSTSFFLSALQPLGYRFIGQWGNQIGLGVVETDFFLTQETPGIKAGAAHVAFSASTRAAVRDFYANALQAGGRPHGSPAVRTDGDMCFNAAVLDHDGNSVEVVFHEDAVRDDGASYGAGQSRVLTWRKDVVGNLSDNKSTVSAATSAAKKAVMPASSVASRSNKAPSITNSSAFKSTPRSRSEMPIVQRSFTAPTLTPQSSNDQITISRKTLVGTILGAAAGAAVAYAMCKSEEDSARAEQEFYTSQAQRQQHPSRPQIGEVQVAQPTYSSPARSVQNASDMDSFFGGGYQQRAIEPAPPSGYQHPSYTTIITAQQPEHMPSSSRSRVSYARSMSLPDGRPQSTLISSFVPSETTREVPEHHSSHSHSQPKSHASQQPAKSSSISSKHSTGGRRKHRSKSRHRSSSRTPTPTLDQISESPREKPSTRTSVLGRSVVDYPSSPYHSSSEQDTGNDTDTVVPSDSISCIGSSSRRSHRSSHHSSSQHHQSPLSTPQLQPQYSARSTSTTTSKRDDSRRASESSATPSSSSRRASETASQSPLNPTPARSKSKRSSSDGKSKSKLRRDSKDAKVMRPDSISEVESDGEEEASTMTPGKYTSARARGSGGSAMSMPIRGITPSMIHDGGRTVASYSG